MSWKCNTCGTEYEYQQVACKKCGHAIQWGVNTPTPSVQPIVAKKKVNGLIITGIVLIGLQILAALGGLASGSFQNNVLGGGHLSVLSLASTIGYFLPGLTGVVLLIIGLSRRVR